MYLTFGGKISQSCSVLETVIRKGFFLCLTGIFSLRTLFYSLHFDFAARCFHGYSVQLHSKRCSEQEEILWHIWWALQNPHPLSWQPDPSTKAPRKRRQWRLWRHWWSDRWQTKGLPWWRNTSSKVQTIQLLTFGCLSNHQIPHLNNACMEY